METPDEFCVIEPLLYHSKNFPPYALPFLTSLNLRTILYMDAGRPSKLVKQFAETHQIELIDFESQPWMSSQDTQQLVHNCEVLSNALKVVLNFEHYPVLILGTNILTGVIRKAENWTASAVLGDYNAYSAFDGQSINSEGSTFIEMLKLESCDGRDKREVLSAHLQANPLVPLILVDLPDHDLQPEWVKKFITL